MDTVFSYQIGWNLEVYTDDMVIKILEEGQHYEDLKKKLTSVRRFVNKFDQFQRYVLFVHTST